jgi:hypothetical protein
LYNAEFQGGIWEKKIGNPQSRGKVEVEKSGIGK